MFTRRFLAVLALGASLVFTAACGNGGNTAKEKTDITFFGSSTLAPLPQAAVKTRLAPRANTAKNLRVNI